MSMPVHFMPPNFLRRAPAWLLGLAAMALAGCAQAPLAGPGAQPLSLRVIAFNDFHGHLEADGLQLSLADPARPGQRLRASVGGADALAGTVAALRAGAAHSVLVSSGDLVGAAPLVSTLFRHESTVEVMNQIGVDLGIPGNHEFDAGQIEFARLLAGGCAAAQPGAAMQSCAQHSYAGARFPLIAANLQRDGAAWLAPTWIKQVGPVRVGFIGAITRTTPSIVLPSGIGGLSFEDEALAINRAAAELQAQGVRALVAVVHEGGELAQAGADWNDERCPGWQGALAEIERRITPAVSVILSAHTHQGYRCDLGDRIVMQATSYGRGLSVVDLAINPRNGQVDRAHSHARNLPVFNAQTDPAQREQWLAAEPEPYASALRAARPDTAVALAVAGYSAAAAPRANQVVGQLGGNFDRSGRTDSAAGRLIADAQLAATHAPETGGAQLALMNAGGVRADLLCQGPAPCPVSFGTLFTAQPFGNGLTVMTLTGADLKALLESQQPAGQDRPRLLSPSAGLSYRWQASAEPGQHVQDLKFQGQAVRPEQRLRLTVNSFLAEGGDGFTLLKTYGERQAGPQDLDALLAHVRSGPAPEPVARVTWSD